MEELLISYEVGIRTSIFLLVFCVVALWEILAPKRVLKISKFLRWVNNLALLGVNSLLVRILFPLAAVGVAAYATDHHWGLFNALETPRWLAIVTSVLLLDFIIYLQHIAMHYVPWLWRLHRVHHADLDFDLTTGGRFHPLEILLSMALKCVVVALLGAPIIAVLIFEVLLNATSVFNHANVRIPHRIDRLVRYALVTPDMHRVHHSIKPEETNSNFGFNVPWWDRLFRTYRAQPAAGHELMVIGIETFRTSRWCVQLPRLLLMPFVSKSSSEHL